MRRCLLAFNQMLFEDLQRLYSAFMAYKEGQPYRIIRQSRLQLDSWAEDKTARMENESLSKSHADFSADIDRAVGNAPKFYKKHLLHSLNDGLGKRDLESLSKLHRYFDYNLNFVDLHAAKPLHQVKVHQPELNLAGMQLRLNHIDQALLAVLETIRISQNKNDHEAILQCLVLLQQIRRVLGTSDKTANRDQERLLLEHIIYQANNLNNAYIFVISCVNLAQVDHMKSSRSAQQVSQKLGEILKQFKVVIEGPLWYDIIQVANKKLLQL